jgi:hypothetical protein
MPATLVTAIAVISLSAISLLAVVAIALAAFVEISRREDRLSPDHSRRGRPSKANLSHQTAAALTAGLWRDATKKVGGLRANRLFRRAIRCQAVTQLLHERVDGKGISGLNYKRAKARGSWRTVAAVGGTVW